GFGIKFKNYNLNPTDRIVFAIRAKESLTFSLSCEESFPPGAGVAEDWQTSVEIKGGEWAQVSVPFQDFQLNPYYKPVDPSQEGNDEFDIYAINQVSFVFPPSETLEVFLGEVSFEKSIFSILSMGLALSLLAWLALFLFYTWKNGLGCLVYSTFQADVAKFCVYLFAAVCLYACVQANPGLVEKQYLALTFLSLLGLISGVLHYKTRRHERFLLIQAYLSPWILVLILMGLDVWFPMAWVLFAANCFYLISREAIRGLWIGMVYMMVFALVYTRFVHQVPTTHMQAGLVLIFLVSFVFEYNKKLAEKLQFESLKRRHVHLRKEQKDLTEYLHSSIENMMDGFALLKPVHGEEGKIEDFFVERINPAGLRIMKGKREDWEKARTLDLFPKFDKTMLFSRIKDVAQTGEPIRMEKYASEMNIFNKVWDVVIYPSANAVAIIFRDITEREQFEEKQRQLDAQMQTVQRLDSLGILAGGIAHEFNNIFMSVLGHVELCMKDTVPESQMHKRLQIVQDSTERAATLTKQILAFAGKGKYVVQKLDLCSLVREMKPSLDVLAREKGILDLRLEETLAIEADATLIKQAVINLVTNAIDAIKDSPVIQIRTATFHAKQAYLDALPMDYVLKEGTYTLLEVTDQGEGMDQETRGKMFDPFYSTKFAGRGMGMAAVMGIVRSHHGAIDVASHPNRGSKITVLFPAMERQDQE
ncbi:PAS domain-containing protein, partial [bacterium]|nr:PAS domain-containing protein [bacterium]